MVNEQANAVVDRDEFCMKCRYNLRTLSISGLCPECATPVAQSLAWSRKTAAEDMQRLTLATNILMFTGVLLGLEYLDIVMAPFTLRQFGYMLWSVLNDLRTFWERAVHMALGALVLVATIELVKVFRTRHLASTLAATAYLVTAGLHLLFYVAVEAHEWVWSRLPPGTIKQDDFDYLWHNWCYAGINCCEFVLTLGAALALRQYAVHWKNKALLVTTALYPLLVAPIFLAWFIHAPMSRSAVLLTSKGFVVYRYLHMADDAPRFYAQWEWALAAAMILYWMHVHVTLRGHNLVRRRNENLA